MTIIQPGDFAVVPNTPVSGALHAQAKWMCGNGFRKYGHAVLLVNDQEILNALPGGAVLEPLPEDQEGWLWSSGALSLTSDQRHSVMDAAMGFRGTPHSTYDYFALAGRRLGIPDPDDAMRAYIEDPTHLIGSQIIDLCYQAAGVHFFSDGRWKGYIHPDDLMAIIKHPETAIFEGKVNRGGK
jgi:hypothetical protein